MSDRERLNVILLYVSALDKSLHFYRELIGIPLTPGLNMPEGDPWYGGHHAEISWREGAYLHFALFPVRPSGRATSGVELAFATADLPGTHERVTRGGAIVLHEPRTEPWGWCVRYLDPDGNIVGLTSRVNACE